MEIKYITIRDSKNKTRIIKTEVQYLTGTIEWNLIIFSMSNLPHFTIIRASRRSISIQVSKDKGLVVRAPFSVPEDIIQAFVEKKADWIMSHMARHTEQADRKNNILRYLGQSYAFEYNPLQKEALIISEGFFTFSGKVQEGRREQLELVKWYRKEAQAHMSERVAHYARRHGMHHGRICITSALGRWGSCSGRDNLSFPWRLMMAPPEVIDYVVVHELAHTVHKNHSPRFWSLVESIMPEWKRHRTHLREEGWKYLLPDFSGK